MTEEEKFHRSINGLGDTWRAMKEVSKKDPELEKELNETELKLIKDKDVRFNSDLGTWADKYYQKYNLPEANKIRSQVRKEAGKFLKNPSQLNKFMRAKSYEEYAAGPYEKILHRLKDPDYKKEKKNNIYNYQPILPGIDEKPKEEIKSIQSIEDKYFDQFLEQQKQQKVQREYELNNTGIAALKDQI